MHVCSLRRLLSYGKTDTMFSKTFFLHNYQKIYALAGTRRQEGTQVPVTTQQKIARAIPSTPTCSIPACCLTSCLISLALLHAVNTRCQREHLNRAVYRPLIIGQLLHYFYDSSQHADCLCSPIALLLQQIVTGGHTAAVPDEGLHD